LSEIFKAISSQIEGKLMKVDIGRNVAYLAAVDGYLICKHAWSRDLDGVWPVIVVVAECIGEI
jgi:hypothetical protein